MCAAIASALAMTFKPETALCGPTYVHLYSTLTPTVAGTWTTVNLNTLYGVPGNSVVEVAFVVSQGNADRTGGVRAVGSGLNRYITVNRASTNDLMNVMVMHVQANATGQIQYYVDNTARTSFVVLGYWTTGTYVERFSTVTTTANNTWQTVNAAAGAGLVGEFVLVNRTTTDKYLGVREVGSSIDRRAYLRTPTNATANTVTMHSKVDASNQVQLYLSDRANSTVYYVGYWSVAPEEQFTELFSDIGKPTVNATWQDYNLSSCCGAGSPSAQSVADIAFENDASVSNNIGARESGTTTPARMFNLRVSGGTANIGIFGKMHAQADFSSGATIQRYHQRATNNNANGGRGRFLVTGNWWTPPNAASYTNNAEAALNNVGARPGQSATVTGAKFGSSCLSAVSSVNIGTYEVACPDVSAWSDTSITFTVNDAVSDYGGAGALVVKARGNNDLTPLNFYVYPKIESLTTPSVANAAREYDAGDSDGVITINGKRFGTAGTVTILGQAATVNSWADTAIQVRVPASIPDDSYTGDIVVTRTTPADNRTATFTGFRILPRITEIAPQCGGAGLAVVITGNHMCQSGTCPAVGDRSNAANNVANSLDQRVPDGNISGWTHASISLTVPAGATTDDVFVTSATYKSNGVGFVYDDAAPAQSGHTPASGTYISSLDPLAVEFALDAVGVCRWSNANQTYWAMPPANECSGGGTTAISCLATGLAEGVNNVYIACADGCSNSVTQHLVYTYDEQAPAQLTWNPDKGAIVCSTSPSIAVTTNENAWCRWSLDDKDYSNMTASGDGTCSGGGTQSLTCATSGLIPVNEYVYISCRDAKGNEQYWHNNENLNYIVDIVAPIGLTNSSPANGATNVAFNPTLKAAGAVDAGPISYFFQIASNSGFTAGLQESGWISGADEWAVPVSLPADTVHYWRVKAKDTCGRESAYTSAFSFRTIPLTPVITFVGFSQAMDASGELTATYNLTDLNNDAARLLVEYSSDGTNWRQARIKSPASAGTVDNTGVGSGTSTGQITGVPTPQTGATFVWLTMSGENEGGAFLEEDDTVYLRVATFDAAQGESKVSAAFKVDNQAPKNYNCSTPPNGTTGVSPNPTLTAAGATDISNVEYYIQLAEDEGFTTGVQASGWQSSVSWNPAALSQSQSYYWHVKARDQFGNEGGYSAPTWDFLVADDEPDVNIISAAQTSTDGSGVVTVTYNVSDPQNDTVSLLALFSVDGGSTWRQAYIQSSSAGAVNNVGVSSGTSTGQITGITTPRTGATLTWHTQNANNEGGAYLGESSNVYIKLTPSDGVNAGATRYSTFFTVDNVAPTGVGLQYPENFDTNIGVNAMLTAQPPSDISTVQYKFQVDSASADWSAPGLQESSWEPSNTWAVSSQLNYQAEYDYRARAKDQYGNEGAWVAVPWRFTTTPPPDSSAWPFDTPGDYSYNSAQITVETGMAKLKPNASPVWMNDSWLYRKAVTVNNSGNPFLLTDQQVKVELNSVVFNFAKARSNGEDIRFADSDGVTALNYWVSSYNSGAQTATIWVKVPSVPQSSTKTIYMYYGNASAPDASSLSTTMDAQAFTDGASAWTNLASSTNVNLTYNGNDVILGSPLIVDGAVVELDCNAGCYFPYIRVVNGGIIKTTAQKALRLYAKEIYVDATSKIDANRMGYPGGAQNTVRYGRNDGTSPSGTPGAAGGYGGQSAGTTDGPGGGGGAHGGLGGSGGGANGTGEIVGVGGGTAYGNNSDQTVNFGGGGGAGGKSARGADTDRGIGGAGGAGGGIVLLDAETITILGAVNANGEAGRQGTCYSDTNSGGGGGGGAGGTVAIRGTNVTIASGASLTAQGGNGGPQTIYAGSGGGGGGGRVKVFCSTCSVAGAMTAAAGSSGGASYAAPASTNGTAGTTYLSPGGSFVYTYDFANSVSGSIVSNNIASFFLGGTFHAQNTLPSDGSAGSLAFQIQKASDSSTLCNIAPAQAAAGFDASGCTLADVPVKLRAALSMTKAPGTPTVKNWTFNYFTRNRADLTIPTSVGSENAFTYFTNTPTISPNSSKGQVFSEITEFTANVITGTVEFQISNNGTSWFYHNGANWVQQTGGGYPLQTNTAAEINAKASLFDNEVGDGTFFFRAFLASDGTQKAELDNVNIVYTLPARPVVTGLAPSSGVAGQEIVINGSSFGLSQSSSTVTFNGIAAGTANYWSANQIKINAPADVATGHVVVTVRSVLSEQSANSLFTVGAPTISTLTPSQGYGGDVVLIEGNNFGLVKGPSTVKFHSGVTATCDTWGNTALVCRVPSGAQTGNITVTTGGGSATAMFTITTDTSLWPFEVPGDYTKSSASVLIDGGAAYLDVVNSPTWFNKSWSRRRALTVSNSSGVAQTDFQLPVYLNVSNFDFDSARSNGEDMRFTASDGTTLINNYWIQSYDSVEKTAVVWVKVPNVPTGGTTLYLYYGNPSAGPMSNKANTFIAESFVDGTAAWTQTNVLSDVEVAPIPAHIAFQTSAVPRTCDENWGNSCFGCTNYNNDCTTCTPPCILCSGASCVGSEAIDSLRVNEGTYFRPSSNYTVTVNYHAYGSNRFSISYQPPGGAWTQMYCSGLIAAGSYSYTSPSYTLNVAPGVHKVRAAMNYNVNCPFTCATQYCDTDELEIYVSYKSGGYFTSVALPGFMGATSFSSPNAQPSGTTLGYKIVKASDNNELCSITRAQAAGGYSIPAGTNCADQTVPVYIRADMQSTNPMLSPTVDYWTLNYYRRKIADVSVSAYGASQGKQYPTSRPTVVNNTGLSFEEIISFTDILYPDGSDVTFQISNNGSNWYYHNGSAWVSASGYAQSNSGTVVSQKIGSFHSDIGPGTFYFKAYLNSNGSQPSGLDGVSVNKAQLTFSQIVNNGAGDRYVQLYNPFSSDYNLSGHVLGIGPGTEYTIPAGQSIPSKGHYIIAKSQADFISRFGCAAAHVKEWTGLNMSAGGDEVYLKASSGAISSIDLVVWGAYNGAQLPEGQFTTPPGSLAPTHPAGKAIRRVVEGYEGNERDSGADADSSPENEEDLAATFMVDEPSPFCAPPMNGSLVINDSDGFTKIANPVITLTCEDPAGVYCDAQDSMRMACSEASLASASWMPFEKKCNEPGYNCAFSITSGSGCNSSEGEKTVYVEFRNDMGNIQPTHPSDSTIYDLTPPVVSQVMVISDKETYLCGTADGCATLTPAAGGAAYYNNLGGQGNGQKMTVELVWDDPGGAKYEYRGQYAFGASPTYDGSNTGPDIDGSDGWKQIYTIDSGETDEMGIKFTVYDKAGNSSIVSLNFVMDNAAPSITYVWPAAGGRTNWYKESPGNVVNIDFGWINKCPLQSAQYRIATGAWTDIFSSFMTTDYTNNWGLSWAAIPEGSNAISVRASDGCGNTAVHSYIENIQGFIFRKDGTPPSITGLMLTSNAEDYFYGSSDGLDCSNVGAYPGVTCTAWFNSAAGEGAGQTIDVAVSWTDTASYNRAQGSVAFGSNPPPDYFGPPWNIYYTVAAGTGNQLGTEASVYDEAGNKSSVKIDYRQDNVKPVSTITNPAAGSWQTADFTLTVSNSDAAPSSGLASCYYRVLSNSVEKLSWTSYACAGNPPAITVGAGKNCDVEGVNICEIQIYSRDKVNSSVVVSRVFSVAWQGPVITNNIAGCPACDNTWRAAGGTVYNIDFSDNGVLDTGEYTIWTGPNRTGTMLKDWTAIFGPAHGSGSFTTDFQIDFDSALNGVNYVSVRASNTASLSTTSTDAFYLRKDTLAPSAPVVTGYDSSAMNVVLTDGGWGAYANPYFAWSADIDNPALPALNSGVKQFNIYFGATPAGVPDTFTASAFYEVVQALVSGETYYLRIGSEDNAGNTTAAQTVFVYKYDDTGLNAVATDYAALLTNNVTKGQQNIVFAQLNLSSANRPVDLISLKVQLNGVDADISAARLVHDTNDNGEYDSGLDTLLGSDKTFASGELTFNGFSLTVNTTDTESLLVLLDISASATQGHTVGIRIQESNITADGAAASFAQSPFSTSLATIMNPATLSSAFDFITTPINTEHDFTVRVTVTNAAGSSRADIVAPDPVGLTKNYAGGATVSLVSGPLPASANLSAGQSQTFVYTFRALTNGSVSFELEAVGTESNLKTPTASNLAQSNLVVITNQGPLLWTFDDGGTTSSFYGSAAPQRNPINEQVIYIGNDNRKLYAIRISDGTKKWEYTAANPIKSTPYVRDYVIYFGDESGNFYAVRDNTTSASLVWSRSVASAAIRTSSTRWVNESSEGRLYFASLDGKMYCRKASDGNPCTDWSDVNLGSPIYSTPASANDGYIYVGASNGTIAKVDRVNANVIAMYNGYGGISASPFMYPKNPAAPLDGAWLWIGALNGSVYKIDSTLPPGSEQVWSFTPSAPIPAQEFRNTIFVDVFSGGAGSLAVYAGNDNGCVYAISDEGEQMWKFPPGAEAINGAVSGCILLDFTTNKLYFGAENHHYYALQNNATAPTIISGWPYYTGGPIVACPSLFGSVVMIPSTNGKIYAFSR